ncbi:MAG: hypothetical protein Q8M08_07160 [Bacteroidales bacterium]|nr:hypothetical protein [Bacteroidales bacterium]
MKKSVWIIAIIALAISACTSQKSATSYVNDDVYNSSARNEPVVITPATPTDQGAKIITAPDNAKVQKPASSTLSDDNNDYSYSSRINRFSSKDTTVGYFDDSYTSSGGNQGGNDPNVNIYLGYGSGYGGFYNPSYNYGYGWGYPYSSWGWDYGWGWPYSGSYYGWGYPYYYRGYNPWYNPWNYSCCYCYGYNDWYSPHYYNNSYTNNNYYGSRKSLHRTDGGTGSYNARSTSTAAGNALNRSEKNNVTPSPRTSPPSPRTTPASQEKYRYTRPANNRQTVTQRSTPQNTGKVQSQTTRQQPTPRYTRPENANPVQRSGNTQSYSSPVYRQPKSSQEYLAPRSQNPGTTRTTNQNSEIRSRSGSSGTGIRQNTTPLNNYNRSNSTPARTGSSGYTAPQRTNTDNSAPTRSGSSGSYSPPSNSNNNSSGSYSAPTRSSSGSSSGSSGGGRRK